MGFLGLLAYLTASYIRPGELFPSLAPYRIMLLIGLLALAGTAVSLLSGPRPTFRASQIYLMGIFMAAMGLSLIFALHWFGGAFQAFLDFAPTATMFFLVVLNVTSWRRLRIVVGLIVALTVFAVLQGIFAYHFGFQRELFVLEYDVAGPRGQVQVLERIRGLGFLHDPNDFAQAMLLVVPLLGLAWRRGNVLRNFFCFYLPFTLLLYGVYLTQSRGGIVSLLFLALLFFRYRLGRIPAAVLTTVMAFMLIGIGVAGGRSFSMEDGSANTRLVAWSTGLQLIKSSPLWGVGYGGFVGHFREGINLTAHNSFVLCFSELGLIGYFVWLALLVITILELRSLNHFAMDDAESAAISRWARALQLSLYTFLVAAFFLSRTYVMTLYLLLALGVAIVDLARRSGKLVVQLSWPKAAGYTGAVEFASIAFIYAVVRFGT